MTETQKPFRVGIYAVPGFALMSYACTVEPLRAANLLSGRVLYEVLHFGGAMPTRSSGAAELEADRPVGAMPQLDLLLVVSGGDPMSFSDRSVFNWLRAMAARGVRIGGISGGPVILARAGLMKDRRMTVHWEHANALAEWDPSLQLERRLYVFDRDRVTCAGGTAPMDMIHAFISEHHGRAFAGQVSDWFMHTGIRASTDPQRAGLIERLGTTSEPVLNAVRMMELHVSDPRTLQEITDFCDVSVRQLNRLFQQELGESTMTYYRKQRLQVARQLLRNSDMPITEIALATGFAGSAHFSRQFTSVFGQPPSKVRRRAHVEMLDRLRQSCHK
jgi:transcriptional regulator GlxA family with amidase domain